MARLSVQYLAIYNNEKLPNTNFFSQKLVQYFAKYKKIIAKDF